MITCIYHKIDADGVSSAALVSLYANFMSEDFLSIGFNYGDEIDLIPILQCGKDNRVFIVDCCLSYQQMKDIHENCTLIWIDHHKSSINNHTSADYHNADGIRCIAFAACELTHRYLMNIGFKPRIKHRLLSTIGIYDCWAAMNCPSIKEEVFRFQLGLRTLDLLDIHNMIDFLEGNTCEYEHVVEDGIVIEQYLKSEYRNLCNNAKRIIISKQYKGMIYSGDRINLYNHMKVPSDIEIIVCNNPNGSVTLYSQTVDVSRIATEYGGGGHIGAAGIESNRTDSFRILEIDDYKPTRQAISDIQNIDEIFL